MGLTYEARLVVTHTPGGHDAATTGATIARWEFGKWSEAWRAFDAHDAGVWAGTAPYAARRCDACGTPCPACTDYEADMAPTLTATPTEACAVLRGLGDPWGVAVAAFVAARCPTDDPTPDYSGRPQWCFFVLTQSPQ